MNNIYLIITFVYYLVLKYIFFNFAPTTPCLSVALGCHKQVLKYLKYFRFETSDN